MTLGKAEEKLQFYARPEYSSLMKDDAELHLAVAAHRAGRALAAEQHYRAFLKQQPGHGGAHHNLGLLIVQRGAPDEALAHFALACRADPARAQNWFSYAKAMLSVGRPAEALPLLEKARTRGISGQAFETVLQQAQDAGAENPDALVARWRNAVVQDSRNPELHFQLGNACMAQGLIAEAIEAYRQAVERNPEYPEAHFRLGSLLSESGHIAQGFAHYLRRAELVHRNGAAQDRRELPHKIKHDWEQREYLSQRGAGDAAFRLENGNRVAGDALNRRRDTHLLLEQWLTRQFFVLDDFLVPAALEKLRRYCAGSTIWHRVYEAGYIGATPEDGLACPLMAQIAEDIQNSFPQVIGAHRFRYVGAFKYDSALSRGTNIHADNAAVNVNFYIAPEEANLDPESGGLDIWEAAPESEIHMRQLNGSDAMARAFLKKSNAKLTRIPHRTNRAIIFRSDLIHKTSDCHFAEGYLNKRINVSLLFGDLSPRA